MRSAAVVLRRACLFTAILHTVGLVVNALIRGELLSTFDAGLFWGLYVALLLLTRKAKLPHRAWRTLVPIGLALAVALVQAHFLGARCRPPDVPALQLYLYEPDSRHEDTWFGRGTHVYQINRHGLRGPAPDAGPDDAVITLVGDSFVFGTGVDDGNTVVEVLQRQFEARGDECTWVTNAGMPGSGLATIPNLLRYGRDVYGTDIAVVLLKDDDFDLFDAAVRSHLAHTSLWYRVLILFDLEMPIDYVRQTLRRGRSAAKVIDAEGAESLLQPLSDAAEGISGLLLLDLNEPRAAEEVTEYMQSAPRWTVVDVARDPRWRSADKIPGDGHWSVAGNESIAAIVFEHLSALVSPGVHENCDRRDVVPK